MDLHYRTIFIELAVERFEKLQMRISRFRKMDPEFHEENFRNTPSSERELVSRLGKFWRHNLSRLGSIVEVFKHITSNYLKDTTKNPTILSISCTNKTLLDIFGSKVNASGAIRLARKAGLVQCTLETYRFNSEWNRSKRYAWNKSVERMVLDLVKEHGIEVRIARKPEKERKREFLKRFRSMNPDRIRVSSKLRGIVETPNMARAILTKDYSYLIRDTKMMADEMNMELPVDQRIRYDWNLHYSPKGYLTKVGARATNMVCSLKAHKNGNTGYSGVWRREYLDREFGFGNHEEFDVHGSIFKVAHLLSCGEWLGNDVDPYAAMFGDFGSDAERTAVKSFAMCLYFDYGKSIMNHNRSLMKDTIGKYGDRAVQKAIAMAVGMMEKFTGQSLDSEIFLHESNIYIKFVYGLRKDLGLKVVQVYDAFYFGKGDIDRQALEDRLKDCAMGYAKRHGAWKEDRGCGNP